MKKLLSLILLLLLLTGCNSELTYSEIKIEKANQDIQNFIEGVQGENGTYLYFNGEKEQYVF
ncbi:hypothetical protein CEW92_16485 [Bacillaceae bacterium SAS-127]|nr:hypothetical protein CEW92_16485 [Bacillaceae bacterium SAS-127]